MLDQLREKRRHILIKATALPYAEFGMISQARRAGPRSVSQVTIFRTSI